VTQRTIPLLKKLIETTADLTQANLAEVRNKALRHGAWFRVLDRTERAILSLTIRCVGRIKSPRLAEIVRAIVGKLRDAMKGRVERIMETTGRQLAQRLSQVAQSWGNISAKGWTEDLNFIQYLTITLMNTPAMFRV